MRRILSVMAAGAAVVLVSSVLAASTLAGGSVAVSGKTPWVFAGFVTEGATYDVAANGYVITAPIPAFHVPGVSKSASGPGGQPEMPCLAKYENDLTGRCAVQGANFGALVAMVVDPSTSLAAAAPFAIGADPSFVAPADGAIFLAANDLNLTYFDNSGQFTVTITAQ